MYQKPFCVHKREGLLAWTRSSPSMARSMSSVRTLSDTMYLLYSRGDKSPEDKSPESSPVPLERTESVSIIPSPPAKVSRAPSPLTLTRSSINKGVKGLKKTNEVQKPKKVSFALPPVVEEQESQAWDACPVSLAVEEEPVQESLSGPLSQADGLETQPDEEVDESLDYGMRQYGADDCPLIYSNEDGASLGY